MKVLQIQAEREAQRAALAVKPDEALPIRSCRLRKALSMTAKITVPVLPKANAPVLRTLSAMDGQISLLRKQKVGATTVKSEAVEALHSLVLRAREEIRQLAGGHQ